MPRPKSKAAKARITGANMDPIVPRKGLFDDDASSEDEQDGGATLSSAAADLKINEEYARRFEHNKKREELHRLEEKFKSKKEGGLGEDEDDEDSSEDETEDDEGFLVTEDLDAEINATLEAIKKRDPRIYDKEAVFYTPVDAEGQPVKEKKEKTMTLRDYHRERYMAGDIGADEDDAPKPKTYAEEQANLKQNILSEINAAAGEDEEWSDDDAFIKPVKKVEAPTENGVHPSRAKAIDLSELDVKNADKNPEDFLSKFMQSKAWAPADGSRWEAFESDEGEDNFPEMAEEFEHAYNMRFEDPNKSNELLKTYSRNLANAKSVRKEELTGRKKQRQLEKERKEAEKKQREEERARLRRLKIDEAAEKLSKIRKAAGLTGKELSDEEWMKFLEDAWDNDRWEEEMRKQFGEEYYAEADDDMSGSDEEDDEDNEDGKSKKKKKLPKKPEWDDDIDIKDIIPDFDDVPDVVLSDLDIAKPDGEEAEAEAEDDDADLGSDLSADEDESRPSKKRKTTADIKKEKQAAKQAAKAELAKLEALVDTKMELDAPRALSAPKDKKYKENLFPFRYRETSPVSFGMTARDILLAPSDAALNEFAGLKKLATFRDAEKKRKERKKLGKKARLRQWRRDTFGREYEATGPTFGFDALDEDGTPLGNKNEGSGANAGAVKLKKRGEKKDEKKKSSGEKKDEKKEKKEGEKKETATSEGADNIIEGERKKKRKRSKNKKDGEKIEA
ncbi:KRI1-like family C-terminal-domain-containing protein [Neurospora tetraspora]|uniref:KRI1-like family C-terminal-domain-containing protein n=1 Tax=Neurospora tetraspora TaxID=94610 RepID=A0AAE0J9S5_9PEZI|nr:KRI1-like family C-terminal-domain-containing protein [Neurospora tetraspora]